MKLKYFLIPMFALVTCGALQAQTTDSSPSPAPAYEHKDHWRHRHHAWIWRELNLTDAQKQQIKSIRQGSKAQFRPALAAVLTAKMKLHQDIANNQGAQAITEDTTALAGAEYQLASVRANQLSQIKGLLTQDQLTTWNDFVQKRQSRMQDRINKLNQPES
ncbi:MAG: Spy/CpxP family protein refolding chaperone [Verrucomicrobia bacterium]|nr:Spy/CpxP family protein refolding chaperone [Verrucomicrobiota bacterium]